MARATIKFLVGLSCVCLVGLFFLAAGGHDAYRTGGRLYRYLQLEDKYQVASATVTQVEIAWPPLTMSKMGGWKWYRVRYNFERPGGRVLAGEDWIYRQRAPPQSLRIAFLPADPTLNRIHTADGIYDEHEYWGQGVLGMLFALLGAAMLVVGGIIMRSLLD